MLLDYQSGLELVVDLGNMSPNEFGYVCFLSHGRFAEDREELKQDGHQLV